MLCLLIHSGYRGIPSHQSRQQSSSGRRDSSSQPGIAPAGSEDEIAHRPEVDQDESESEPELEVDDDEHFNDALFGDNSLNEVDEDEDYGYSWEFDDDEGVWAGIILNTMQELGMEGISEEPDELSEVESEVDSLMDGL